MKSGMSLVKGALVPFEGTLFTIFGITMCSTFLLQLFCCESLPSPMFSLIFLPFFGGVWFWIWVAGVACGLLGVLLLCLIESIETRMNVQ
jgi:hypothetical protein